VSKKPIIGCIILAVIIGVIFVGAQINPDNPENTNVVFHVTLADPALYDVNGVYYGSFTVEEGCYKFRFVANGDSPKNLSITLRHIATNEGHEQYLLNTRIFTEDYNLQGTLVESELSSWEVWDYLGQKRFCFDPSAHYLQYAPELDDEIEIGITPHRNYDGPVSIFIVYDEDWHLRSP
jgi:hypothetical protein